MGMVRKPVGVVFYWLLGYLIDCRFLMSGINGEVAGSEYVACEQVIVDGDGALFGIEDLKYQEDA
jgi:hypothetical protein